MTWLDPVPVKEVVTARQLAVNESSPTRWVIAHSRRQFMIGEFIYIRCDNEPEETSRIALISSLDEFFGGYARIGLIFYDHQFQKLGNCDCWFETSFLRLPFQLLPIAATSLLTNPDYTFQTLHSL